MRPLTPIPIAEPDTDPAVAGASAGPDPSPRMRPVSAVRIDPEARPDRSAQVTLGTFDGPLALLLALIEQRQLDVLEVPLGELAGAYLEALSELSADHLPHISAFVSVAAQLILIKSRALLPRSPALTGSPDEGPDPETELRARLILYRRYRDAAAALAARLEAGVQMRHREPSVAFASAAANARPIELPPLDPAVLVEALSVPVRVAPPDPPPVELMTRVVTLEERARVIRAALRRAPQVVLQELLAGVRDRVVITVTFLAMLELVKGRELAVEQEVPFGPISCRRLRPEERLVAVPVEGTRAPA
jgi:segregation and condensation protein A